MEEIDFKVTLKHLYDAPTHDFTEVEVTSITFVKIDGQGKAHRYPTRLTLIWQRGRWSFVLSSFLKSTCKALDAISKGTASFDLR